MTRTILQRRLVDVSDRLKRLRAELAVTDEQVSFLESEAEERSARRASAGGNTRLTEPWHTRGA